jgi:hypothetical protein
VNSPRYFVVLGVFAALPILGMTRPVRAAGAVPRETPIAISPEQIEAAWVHEDRIRAMPPSSTNNGRVTPEEDAAGGCDGIITGQWGFHTENQQEPWWQVDLGGPIPIDRLRIYNRCDNTAPRASRLIVLLSRDGKSWIRAYQHDGTTFHGKPDGKPLVVSLAGAKARYVRLQLPGKSYFHLDEVEVYAVGRSQNVALHRPATQSSASRWSTRHVPQEASKPGYGTALVIQRGRKLAEALRGLGQTLGREVEALDRVALRLEQWRVQNLDRPEKNLETSSGDSPSLQLFPARGEGGRSPAEASNEAQHALYLEARWAVRRMALANPLLDFDAILFAKRAPGTLPHISDQFYGWWSRPGGGIFLLKGFKTANPRLVCLTEG